MAENLKANPLTNIWAENTNNKVTIDSVNRVQGIAYKGQIVSDQLNGFGNDIYSSVYFNQFSGGLYQPQLTYHKNQFCTLLWKESVNLPIKKITAICINDNSGSGIQNNPPIINAVIAEQNGIPIYSQGSVNSSYWVINMDDIQSSFKTEAVNTDMNNEICYKLCDNLTSVTPQLGETSRVYQIKGKLTGYTENQAYQIAFTARTTLILIGDQLVPTKNVWGVGQWDIDFYNCSGTQLLELFFTGLDVSLPNPLRASIILSDEGLYLTIKGLTKIVIEGLGNIKWNLSLTTIPSDNVYYLPVRPFGGSQVLPLLGSVTYDAGSNKSNSPYLYGKIELSNNLGGVNPSELTRALSLFKTPALNNVYNSAVNKLTSLNTTTATDNKWNTDSFIRMSNDRSNTWQYQEDVFHDVFSFTVPPIDGASTPEWDQNNLGRSHNFLRIPCMSYRGAWAGYTGIWKTNVGPNDMQHLSAGPYAFDLKEFYVGLDLHNEREYKATETRPKNISLNCFVQVF